MASQRGAIVRELSRINKKNLINIIINECVPDNSTVSDELRKFVRGDISYINRISKSSKIPTGLNLDTNICLGSEIKVLKKQLDCTKDITDNLKKLVDNVEFDISLLPEDKQTGKSTTILCDVALP
ncbi:hypothetical protein HHI36_007767, partial [Cryptolaemus montrouzieri]